MKQINYEKLKGFIWLNGKFVSARNAKTHVLSHSLHFASAAFEGIRVYNKQAFKLKEHIRRLFFSAKILDIKIPYNQNKVEIICNQLIKKQKLYNGYIRPIVWRGGQSMAPAIIDAKINLAVAAWEWPVYYSKKAIQNGISLTISKWKRPPSVCAPVHSKCSGLYMICTLAIHDARKKNFDDALMLDMENNICETTSSNIFFIIKNTIVTPKADCFLNGITRKTVIDICKKNKIKVLEKKLKLIDIKKADGCFVTGTAAEVTPVKKINGLVFKNKNKHLSLIQSRFKKLIHS